jgi:Zn-dependent protease
MFRSWKIARIFGIDVYIHWSFFILFFVFLWLFKPADVESLIFTLLSPVALFVCVLVHEYGHSLTARLFGIGTKDITLFPLGGVARLERMSEDPIEEIIISLAGPAVNVVIAAVLFPVLLLSTDFPIQPGEKYAGPTTGVGFAWWVLALNAVLAIFNMAPAFPMDGGRIFRAFLAFFLPRLRATKVAVFVGMFVAGLMAIFALASGNPMLLLISMLVPVAGMLELAMLQHQAEMRRRRRQLEFLNARSVEEWAAPTRTPPEPNFSGYTWDAEARAWVEWRNGWPVRLCRMRRW